ncbi:malate dehydrogenase [Chloroflexota bacterium]
MIGKVSVIGAGNVGATSVQRIAERGYADVVLFDIIDGLPQGKSLDMMESMPVLACDRHITGTNDYQSTVNSDVVVVTSGVPRKPGMTREQLLETNKNIITDVIHNVIKHSPDCIIIVVTNPLDAMAYLALRVSGFPRNKVIGLSGVLDTARLRSFIAAELNVSVTDVSACILGQHGEKMVILPRLCSVSGVPLTKLLSPVAIDCLVERTLKAGAEIVGLLKTGSAFYAPSAAVAEMVEAIILDKKKILPCAAYLDGEYGIKDTFLSVPVKVGKVGIEEIIEFELTAGEKSALDDSAQAVRGLVKAMGL